MLMHAWLTLCRVANQVRITIMNHNTLHKLRAGGTNGPVRNMMANRADFEIAPVCGFLRPVCGFFAPGLRVGFLRKYAKLLRRCVRSPGPKTSQFGVRRPPNLESEALPIWSPKPSQFGVRSPPNFESEYFPI